MSQSESVRRVRRRGLTLLELVVVLTILVAIGGILVPMLPNFIHRSNVASCVVNIPEIDKMMQTYFNLRSEYPNNMDSILTDTGTIPTYFLDGSDGEYGLCYESHALDADEAAALQESGIRSLVRLVEDAGGDWNPTMWPYSSSLATAPSSVDVEEGTSVLTLTTAGEQLMGLDPDGRYAVFGLNAPCTLFRDLAAEPAYHFADTPAEDPATYYMCFGVVFQFSTAEEDGSGGTNDVALGEALYKGCLAFHDFGPSTAAMHTREWWGRMKDERQE